MSLTSRELWTVIHGMFLGALFLLAFSGGFVGLWGLRPEFLTAEGIRARLPAMRWGTAIMAALAWLTCLTGTYVVYVWYRATPPQGASDLAGFPRALLLANPGLATWHNFGMEWKEHVAWMAPIMATAVGYVVWSYGESLVQSPRIRRALLILFTLSFVAAAVAGLFGAFLNKAAPVR
jgi:hypothetical protein